MGFRKQTVDLLTVYDARSFRRVNERCHTKWLTHYGASRPRIAQRSRSLESANDIGASLRALPHMSHDLNKVNVRLFGGIFHELSIARAPVARFATVRVSTAPVENEILKLRWSNGESPPSQID